MSAVLGHAELHPQARDRSPRPRAVCSMGQAITPSQLHAYTSSMYSGPLGRRSASRSPAPKPCLLSAAAARNTVAKLAKSEASFAGRKRRLFRIISGAPAEGMRMYHLVFSTAESHSPALYGMRRNSVAEFSRRMLEKALPSFRGILRTRGRIGIAPGRRR
jgi:hypothetical protein